LIESIDEVDLLAHNMSKGVVVIQTTLPRTWEEYGVGSFCQNLIENGAKCVEYSEVCSMYEWDGKLNLEKEWRIEMKCSEMKKEVLLDFLERNHPYDLPQILFHVAGSSEAYGRWVQSQDNTSV
tara:strand:+ start:156 stop:527 length:372 start_codon:yes stop_codon:yes gene_type:complete